MLGVCFSLFFQEAISVQRIFIRKVTFANCVCHMLYLKQSLEVITIMVNLSFHKMFVGTRS